MTASQRATVAHRASSLSWLFVLARLPATVRRVTTAHGASVVLGVGWKVHETRVADEREAQRGDAAPVLVIAGQRLDLWREVPAARSDDRHRLPTPNQHVAHAPGGAERARFAPADAPRSVAPAVRELQPSLVDQLTRPRSRDVVAGRDLRCAEAGGLQQQHLAPTRVQPFERGERVEQLIAIDAVAVRCRGVRR